MALTCGNEGSTASETVAQINLNEDNIALNEGRITAVEATANDNSDRLDVIEGGLPTPRGSLRLVASKTQTIDDAVTPVLLTAFDTVVTERNGIVVDEVAHSITYSGPDVESAIITIGLNIEFPGAEELETYLYINGNPYSDTPINLQGEGNGKPEIVYWQSDIALATDDVLTVRGRNADAGSFTLTYLRATFRLDI